MSPSSPRRAGGLSLHLSSIAATAAVVLCAACGGGEDPAHAPAQNPSTPAATTRDLTLAAYTTPREAYAELLPAFAAEWKAKTGETLTFEESYQASGAQARAVIGGLEADIVALSLAPDVTTIAEAGLITHAWDQGPHGGIVTRSLVVLAVRPGNPKNIQGWEDLTRPDVQVLTPNVKTSGGAMWNIAALWGAALRGHAGVPANDPAAATALLGRVLKNVAVMDKGARESILTFEGGVGDVAITYENEVLVAKAKAKAEGKPGIDYVVPPSTIIIENPLALVDTAVDKHGDRAAAEALVAYLHTAPAQKLFAAHGLRPADPALTPADLPTPKDSFTIADLGGWKSVQDTVFSPTGAYAAAQAGATP
jgi:sulfate transport system substrate-binding protein